MRSAVIAAAVMLAGCGGVALDRDRESPPVCGEAGFAEKPSIVRTSDGWTISFAAKKACDATVAIMDKEGRVARHLASGMLGKNAPEPFQKNSLRQQLTWDGKDNAGVSVPAGCSLRVGLGVRPTFDRIVDVQPPSIAGRGVVGLSVAEDGTLWVVQGSAWERKVGSPEVVAFGRDGKYLRTIVPARTDLPERETKVPSTILGRWGRRNVLIRDGYLLTISGEKPSPDVGPGQRLVRIRLDGTTDDTYQGPTLAPDTSGLRMFLAMSTDGSTVYLSSLYHNRQKKASQQVYRARLTDAAFVPFAGETCVAGAGEKHFNDPRGLAVDGKGRVLVADLLNDRIQVFSDAGALEKTLAVRGPEQVIVNPGTGELYVLSVRDRGEKLTYGPSVKWDAFKDKSIVKYKSADDFTEVCRIDLPNRPLYLHDTGPILALDASAKPPVLWVSCVGRQEEGDYLWKIEDRGNSLARVENPIGRYYNPFGLAGCVVAADPATGDAYIGGRATPTVLKVDGRTGEVTSLDQAAEYIYGGDKKPYKARQIAGMAVDGQGRIYFRLMGTWSGMSNWVVRVNADQSPAPFEKAGKEIGITQPSHGYHSLGLGLTAGGDIVAVDLVPGGKHRDPSEHNVLNVYGPDGVMKKATIIPHMTSAAWGPKFDRRGGMYFTEAVRPIGQEPETVGSLVRFAGMSGELVFGDALVSLGARPKYEMRLLEKRIVPVYVKGADWIHYGVSPVPFGHCICSSAQFDVDRFDRIAVMDANRKRVRLLDSAGNWIATIGEYGNRDSRGPASDLPVPPISMCRLTSVACTDDAVLLFDAHGNRMVRVRLAYAAEETTPVP